MPPDAQQGVEPPLTDEERRKLRRIIDSDEKAAWLRSMLRAWGAWVAGGIVSLIALNSTLRDWFKEWLR